jgi:hypothetical protein
MAKFYSPINLSTFIFADGSRAVFYGNEYNTEDQSRIAQLQSAVKSGAPIFNSPDNVKISSPETELVNELQVKAATATKEESQAGKPKFNF